MTSSSLSSSIDPRLRDTAPSGTVYSQRTHGQSQGTTLSPTAANPSPQYQSIHNAPPHPNLYLPHPNTTQSDVLSPGRNSIDDGNDAVDSSQNDLKRPRACEACRGLKVRCEPDANDLTGPCKRCAKANRNCVVTAPSRKRQKKTDSRVAELEKKIDALTASLQATKSGTGHVDLSSENGGDHERLSAQAGNNPYEQVTNGGYRFSIGSRPEDRMHSNEWMTPDRYPKVQEYESRKAPPPPMVMAGQKRKHIDNREHSAVSKSMSSVSGGAVSKESVDSGATAQHQYGYTDSLGDKTQTHEYADVIDRGVITAETATKMFKCYVEQMAPHLPVVVFPPRTTAADIRKTKPILFLAILSASSGINCPEVQRTLTKEVMSIYADRIVCNGEKTLELIQALHVSALWYWPPEHYEEMKFYQLIHIAAVMAIDIGMGKRKSQKSKTTGLWRDHPWRRTPYPDPETIEARRAWLGCYFLCCNISMGLRRVNLLRWTPYMSDCMDVLENSPEAAMSDKLLCQWVRCQHIAEEIGTQFSMDDPTANISIADSKVQYALKGFERDLEKWSNQVPPEVQTPTLKITEHIVNLYMHEVAMHVDHNVDEFKPPFTEVSLGSVGDGTESDPLTPAHISALSICLTSIDSIFDTFLKFDIEVIRCLPMVHFFRVAYAIIVLIKMYFAAAIPHSEFGKVINKDNMKVEQYLDGLVETFRATAAGEKSRPAARFLMVLIMLKSWFHHQREGKLGPDKACVSTPITRTSTRGDGVTPANAAGDSNQRAPLQRHGQQLGYSPANTPLQLLSEVATGNSERPNSYSGSTNHWQQSQQQHAFVNYESLSQLPPTMPQGYGQRPGGVDIDPALSADLEYTIGEQAMGLTLGDGDFGQYFGDDTFFGNLMDSVGGTGTVFEGF